MKLEPPLKIKVFFRHDGIERKSLVEVRGYHEPTASTNPLEPDDPGEVDIAVDFLPLYLVGDVEQQIEDYVREYILDCLKFNDEFQTELDIGEIE